MGILATPVENRRTSPSYISAARRSAESCANSSKNFRISPPMHGTGRELIFARTCLHPPRYARRFRKIRLLIPARDVSWRKGTEILLFVRIFPAIGGSCVRQTECYRVKKINSPGYLRPREKSTSIRGLYVGRCRVHPISAKI